MAMNFSDQGNFFSTMEFSKLDSWVEGCRPATQKVVKINTKDNVLKILKISTKDKNQ